MDFWRPKASSSANQCAPKSTTLHIGTAVIDWYLADSNMHRLAAQHPLSCNRHQYGPLQHE